jgi:hypothetical protein
VYAGDFNEYTIVLQRTVRGFRNDFTGIRNDTKGIAQAESVKKVAEAAKVIENTQTRYQYIIDVNELAIET